MDNSVELYKKVLDGSLKRFPNRFWIDPGAEENAKEITRYFIEKVLVWNEEDIKKNMTEMTFRKHKLSGMLEYVFDRSPFKALENAYPGQFKEWELKAAPKHIWEIKEKREEAIRWLLLKVNKDKYDELTNIDFLNNGLGGLLDYLLRYKESNNINRIKVEKGISSRERVLNITFNKSGGTSSRNSITTRLSLPTSWVRQLGINEKEPVVKLELKDDKIIIKKMKGKYENE